MHQSVEVVGPADHVIQSRAYGQWLTLAILSGVTALCIGGVLVSFSLYLPVIAKTEPWSGAMIGGALTLMLLSLNVAAIAAGAVADRTDPRRALAVGVLTLGLGCWIATSWHTIASFYFGAALIGLGMGAATITPSVSILTAAFVRREGLGLGVYFAALALGAALAPLAQSTLISSFGWRRSLQLTGLVIAGTVVLIYLIPRPQRRRSFDSDTPVDDAQQKSGWAGLRNRGFVYLVAGLALASVSTQGVLYSVIDYLIKFGMQSASAVEVFSANSLLSVPALLGAGILADHWGPGRILRVGLAAQAIGTLSLLAAFTPHPMGMVSLASFVVMLGITSGLSSQLAPLILREVGSPEHYGMLLGVAAAISGTFAAFAPLLTAGLLNSGGGYTSVFSVYSAMCLIAIPLFAMARKSRV